MAFYAKLIIIIIIIKNSSSEKVATIDGSVFWKSTRSKKVALQKKIVMRDIAFL